MFNFRLAEKPRETSLPPEIIERLVLTVIEMLSERSAACSNIKHTFIGKTAVEYTAPRRTRPFRSEDWRTGEITDTLFFNTGTVCLHFIPQPSKGLPRFISYTERWPSCTHTLRFNKDGAPVDNQNQPYPPDQQEKIFRMIAHMVRLGVTGDDWDQQETLRSTLHPEINQAIERTMQSVNQGRSHKPPADRPDTL